MYFSHSVSNFLGRGSPSPLPRPLPPFFLGLRPRFGLRPQNSGASRPRLSTKNLSKFMKLCCAPPMGKSGSAPASTLQRPPSCAPARCPSTCSTSRGKLYCSNCQQRPTCSADGRKLTVRFFVSVEAMNGSQTNTCYLIVPPKSH